MFICSCLTPNQLQTQYMRYWKIISIFFLILFHGIGLYLLSQNPENIRLSWINLLVTLFVLLTNEKLNLKLTIAIITIYITGFIVEVIGVQTHYLFGNYSYGYSLGLKQFGVPLIIGVNWISIVIASTSVANKIVSFDIPKAIISGLLATALDYLIEPVAIQFDMWNWATGNIPFYNYLCWFIFATLFAFLYSKTTSKLNPAGIYVYFTWTVFFIIVQLNFM